MPIDARASSLIDLQLGAWKSDLIQYYFNLTDASTILSIPISPRLPKGRFIICSSYKLAQSLSPKSSHDETSNDQDQRKFWKVLQSSNVSNKLKSFAQRASRNILPTKANLCHRKVLDDPICEACGVAAEFGGHVFWDCDQAREIWRLSSIPLDTRGARFLEFQDLLQRVMFVQQFSEEVICLIITIAQSMWFNKNQARHGQPRQIGPTVLCKARFLVDEFQATNFKFPVVVEGGITQQVPSKPLWYKINVDDVVFSSLGASGIGVVIRDSGGRVAATLSKKYLSPFGSIEAEAKAIEDGVQFAWDVGVQDVIFECDSKIVFDAPNGTSDPPATMANIFRV